MRPLDSHQAILRATSHLLDAARAWGRFPTPVDDIVSAAKLVEPRESLLSDSILSRAPRHLTRLFRRLTGRIRGVLDRRAREIHLDPEVTYEPKRRFIRLHETVHDILPWQRALGFADDDETLAPHIRRRFERESNQGAAELLFQQDRFGMDADCLAVGLGAVSALAQRYGASLRAALRRYIEGHRGVLLGIVLDPSPLSIDPLQFRRHELIFSGQFITRFGSQRWPPILELGEYPFLADTCAAGGLPGKVRAGEWWLVDLGGARRTLKFELLLTRYNVLFIAWLPQGILPRKKVILV